MTWINPIAGVYAAVPLEFREQAFPNTYKKLLEREEASLVRRYG